MSVGKDGVPGRRLSALTNVIILMIFQLKEPPRRLRRGKEMPPRTSGLVSRLCSIYSGSGGGGQETRCAGARQLRTSGVTPSGERVVWMKAVLSLPVAPSQGSKTTNGQWRLRHVSGSLN